MFRNMKVYPILLLILCSDAAAAGLQVLPAESARKAVECNSAGVAFMDQNLFKEAVGAFKEALKVDPAFSLAKVNLGIALFFNQDSDEAFRVLSEVESREPENPYVLFTLGLAYKKSGESEKAMARFVHVTRIDPRCSAAHYNIGVLYARQGKEELEENSLRRALELDPGNTGALYVLGSMLIKKEKTAEGKQILERFRALQKKSVPQAGMGSGSGYGEMGRYSMAREPAGR